MRCPVCGLENPPNSQYCDCKYDFSKKDASLVEGLDSYLKILCVLFPVAGLLLFFHYKAISKKKADESLIWTIVPAAIYITGSIAVQLVRGKNPSTHFCTRQYTLTGKVTDETKKPIPHITVSLGSGEGKSSVDGSYKFTFTQEGPPKKIGGLAFGKGVTQAYLDPIDETASSTMSCAPTVILRNIIVYPSP
jgi:hypothetical protein